MKNLFFKIILILCLSSFGATGMAKLNTVSSSFSAPTGIAFDSSGNMYVTNWSGNSIDKVSPEGEKVIFYSGIHSPAGIIIDSENNIYVASYRDDYILKIDAQGNANKISEGYHTPTGIAFSNSGQLLITNRSSGEIVSFDLASGEKSVLISGLTTPVGVTQMPDNSLVVSQYSGYLTLITADGKKREIGAAFNRPGVGIVTISDTSIVVIDNGAGALRQVNVQTGQTETLLEGLSGAVGLAIYQHSYYIGTWNDGSVHKLHIQ